MFWVLIWHSGIVLLGSYQNHTLQWNCQNLNTMGPISTLIAWMPSAVNQRSFLMARFPETSFFICKCQYEREIADCVLYSRAVVMEPMCRNGIWVNSAYEKEHCIVAEEETWFCTWLVISLALVVVVHYAYFNIPVVFSTPRTYLLTPTGNAVFSFHYIPARCLYPHSF